MSGAGWRLAARLAARELRGGLKGFAVFLTCLILGTGTIAGVQSVSQSMMASLSHDSRHILGGDLSFRRLYQPATPQQLADLREHGVVSGVVDMRAMARRDDDARAAMVELKAVDGLYPLYGDLDIRDGQDAPVRKRTAEILFASGHDMPPALAEQELLTQLGIGVGDIVQLGAARFRLAGVIAREPDRMSTARYTLAPRLMIADENFAATGLGAAGNQVTYNYRLFAPQIDGRDALLAAEETLEAKLGEGWRGRSYYNAAPGIKRSIDQLTLFLTLIALSTLVIGGTGISSAVRAFLDGRLPVLATLKSLGAPRRLVLRVYLLQILAIATLGIGLGLLLGAGLAQLAGAVLSQELSLTHQGGLYPRALLLAAGFGYLAVFVFCLWPLGRAVETSPRDLFRDAIGAAQGRPPRDVVLLSVIAGEILALLAVATAQDRILALCFVLGALGSFAVFRLYAGAMQAALRRLRPRRMPALRLAIANLSRPGNATAAVVLALGLGLTVLSAVALVENNLSRLLRDDLAADAPSFFFLDVEPAQKDAFAAIVENTAGARDLRLTPSYRGRIIAVNGVPAEQALVDRREEWVIRSDRGFTYAAEQPAHSRITEGAWWPQDFNTRLQGRDPAVSISSDVQRAFDIGVGDKITVNIMGVDITAAVMNVRDINWASFTMNFAVTFAPGPLDMAPTNLLATAVVPRDAEIALQSRIARDMPNITSVRVGDALALAEKLVGGVLLGVRLTAAVTLLAGVMVLAGALSAARQRQLYDAIVFKVLGAGRGRILRGFLLEYALLALVTAGIAAAIGTAAAYGVVSRILELPWLFSWGPVLTTTALALGITWLAGAFGVLHILRQKPAPYLRNQ